MGWWVCGFESNSCIGQSAHYYSWKILIFFQSFQANGGIIFSHPLQSSRFIRFYEICAITASSYNIPRSKHIIWEECGSYIEYQAAKERRNINYAACSRNSQSVVRQSVTHKADTLTWDAWWQAGIESAGDVRLFCPVFSKAAIAREWESYGAKNSDSTRRLLAGRNEVVNMGCQLNNDKSQLPISSTNIK
jgi:hypothetical protein